jgi:hypothetical protein
MKACIFNIFLLNRKENNGIAYTTNSFLVHTENNIPFNTLNNNINVENNNDKSKNNLNANIDFVYLTSQNSVDMMSQVKKVVEYNTNYINENLKDDLILPCKAGNKNNNPTNNIEDEKTPFTRPQSVISNFSQISPVDNIKILNEFKNNIEDRIKNLKNKLIVPNSSTINNYSSSGATNKSPLPKLNYEKFSKMRSQNLLNVLYFFDTNDLFHVMNLNKEIKSKFLSIISEFCKNVTYNFDKQYLRYLKSESRFLTFKKFKKNKRAHLKLNLVIKARIVSDKLKDKTVAIGYRSKFPCDKESLKNIFKFDVRAPGPLSFWVMREYTNVNTYLNYS